MSIAYDTRATALGDDALTEVEFDFLVTKASDVLITIVEDGEDTIKVRGDDEDYVSDLTFNAVTGGGTVTLVDPLATGQTIYVDLDVQEPDQTSQFRIVNNYLTSFRAIEAAMDYIVTQVQTLMRHKERTVKLPRHVDVSTLDLDLPEDTFEVGNAEKTLIVNSDGTGWSLGPTATTITTAIAAAAASAAAALASQVAAAASAAAAALSEAAAAVSAAAAAASATAAANSAASITTEMYVNTFSGDDVTVDFTLTQAPETVNNCHVYISGVYQNKAGFSVAGTTLTFSEAPPTGVDNIEVIVHSSIVGVVGDDTITTSKLVDGAVTDAKITRAHRTITATDSGVDTDEVVFADATTGNIIYTAPAVADVPTGKEITVKNICTNANTVQVKGSGAETIDGNNTYSTDLLTMDSIKIKSNGTVWYRIG